MIFHIVFAFIYFPGWAHFFLYIGPGMGGGLISLIIAFLISFFTFLVAVIWYPIKKVIDFFKRVVNSNSSKASKKNIPGDNSTNKEEI
jgi:hypothetical protein